VALDPGEEPDWSESLRYIDSLILEQIEDDLFEQCGVDVDNDRRETWLDTVKERLRSDLEAFRRDVEGDHDEIEEWDFRGGRIFFILSSLQPVVQRQMLAMARRRMLASISSKRDATRDHADPSSGDDVVPRLPAHAAHRHRRLGERAQGDPGDAVRTDDRDHP